MAQVHDEWDEFDEPFADLYDLGKRLEDDMLGDGGFAKTAPGQTTDSSVPGAARGKRKHDSVEDVSESPGKAGKSAPGRAKQHIPVARVLSDPGKVSEIVRRTKTREEYEASIFFLGDIPADKLTDAQRQRLQQIDEEQQQSLAEARVLMEQQMQREAADRVQREAEDRVLRDQQDAAAAEARAKREYEEQRERDQESERIRAQIVQNKQQMVDSVQNPFLRSFYANSLKQSMAHNDGGGGSEPECQQPGDQLAVAATDEGEAAAAVENGPSGPVWAREHRSDTVTPTSTAPVSSASSVSSQPSSQPQSQPTPPHLWNALNHLHRKFASSRDEGGAGARPGLYAIPDSLWARAEQSLGDGERDQVQRWRERRRRRQFLPPDQRRREEAESGDRLPPHAPLTAEQALSDEYQSLESSILAYNERYMAILGPADGTLRLPAGMQFK